MLVDARLQHWKKWLFAMFEVQRLVVRVGCIDGSDDDPPLMANILPCDASTFAGAFTVLERNVKWNEMFRLTR